MNIQIRMNYKNARTFHKIEMGKTCRIHKRETENTNLGGNSQGKILLGRSADRCENNTEIDFRKIGL
jgi:hypothetical protein